MLILINVYYSNSDTFLFSKNALKIDHNIGMEMVAVMVAVRVTVRVTVRVRVMG